MNENTNTAAASGDTNPETGTSRTFSQDDVNRIVGERLAKEKNKADADFAKKEQEFAQREIRLTAKELLSERGLPVQLLDALNCASKESMNMSVDIIQEAFSQIKSERSKLIIKGAVPANSGNEEPDKPVTSALRKAMGLRA